VEISCIVVAGGKSSRLGRNKLVENLGGKLLLERVLDTLSRFKSEIIVVTAANSSLPALDRYPQVRVVQDVFPNKGSLGGIYSGLLFSKSFYNLVVAGDMPFLSVNLLHYMLDIAPGYDLVAYWDGQQFEPLHAFYSKNCLSPFQMLIQRENVRIMEILRYTSARCLTLAELEEVDPDHLSFFNINCEADLHKAQEIVNNRLLQPSFITRTG
jgi:molybdenum cofactor guanylyltransferase